MSAPIVTVTIAGSDPSGGAGVQGDLKTFSALGTYGCAVLTALTAQSTRGVTGIHTVPADFVREQVETLLADVRVEAVKIGMLATTEIIEVVGRLVQDTVRCPVVLDPVMVSTAGSRLLDAEAVGAMADLLPLVDAITPNLPEAAVLVGGEVATGEPAMRDQVRMLHRLGARRVLLKGGHGSGPDSCDLWSDETGEHLLTAPRVSTVNTHGTGCALSSAIAALLPQRDGWLPAVRDAKTWLTGALQHADELHVGQGPGPVHHFHLTRRSA